MDELLVQAACEPALQEGMARELQARVQAAVHVRPRVQFVQAAEIYDPDRDAKAARFVDRRPATGT